MPIAIKSQMDDFIRSLPGILRSAGASPEVTEAAAIAVWKHVAGDGLRNHAVPVNLVDRTLVVSVADPVWQKQLGAMKDQLLFRINSMLGQTIVSKIEFRIDPQIACKQSLQKKVTNEVADDEIPFELRSAASSINDRQLRQTFLRAAMGSVRRLEKKG
jgi:hypothetical protein